MTKEKRHNQTIRPKESLYLKALETMDYRKIKGFSNYLYILIEEDYKRNKESKQMEQLINIFLEGNKKDLEDFIIQNNINISPKEYWDLLQKFN